MRDIDLSLFTFCAPHRADRRLAVDEAAAVIEAARPTLLAVFVYANRCEYKVEHTDLGWIIDGEAEHYESARAALDAICPADPMYAAECALLSEAFLPLTPVVE